MDGKTRRYLEEKSKIFKALGHPTRLFIVEELARGEAPPPEFTRPEVAKVLIEGYKTTQGETSE